MAGCEDCCDNGDEGAEKGRNQTAWPCNDKGIYGSRKGAKTLRKNMNKKAKIIVDAAYHVHKKGGLGFWKRK